MHLFLADEDSEVELRSELALAFPGTDITSPHPLLFAIDHAETLSPPLPAIAFARQFLPDAQAARVESIGAWARLLFDSIVGTLAEGRPWRLHIEPHYGARPVRRMGARAWHTTRQRKEPAIVGHAKDQSSDFTASDAGRQRCQLIREALKELLHKKRRHLLRHLFESSQPFGEDASLVQLLLTAPGSGFISIASAPAPFLHRQLLSPFPKGQITIPPDLTAPSRAFAKLVEAELRLGRGIQPGETCVDLGAAPGSWTFVAVNRGATVIAVDRSRLREDMMVNPRVQFVPGDAFGFHPRRSVDWLLCDVIAPPDRSAQLLLEWLRRGWCRRFVVTLKLKDELGINVLDVLKRDLPPLTSELLLSHLCANKKEACVMGTRR